MLFKRKKRNPSEWVRKFAFLPVCVSHDTATGVETYVWLNWYETRVSKKDQKHWKENRLSKACANHFSVCIDAHRVH